MIFAWRVIKFWIITLLCSSGALLTVLFAPVWTIGFFGALWGRLVTRASGVTVEAEGFENIDPSRGSLLLSTHTSHFDTLCLYAVLPVRVRFVAKRSLALIPILGWVILLGVSIVIDRKSKQSALRSIARARRALSRGEFILMFPEGTRTPEGTVGPLKKGPFYLAEEARVPIIPIGIIGTGDVLRAGDWKIRPGRVRVRAGVPILPSELPEDPESFRKTLMDRVDAALRGMISTDSLDSTGGRP